MWNGAGLREELSVEENREVGLHEPFGAQSIVRGSHMSEIELQDLDLY